MAFKATHEYLITQEQSTKKRKKMKLELIDRSTRKRQGWLWVSCKMAINILEIEAPDKRPEWRWILHIFVLQGALYE